MALETLTRGLEIAIEVSLEQTKDLRFSDGRLDWLCDLHVKIESDVFGN